MYTSSWFSNMMMSAPVNIYFNLWTFLKIITHNVQSPNFKQRYSKRDWYYCPGIPKSYQSNQTPEIDFIIEKLKSIQIEIVKKDQLKFTKFSLLIQLTKKPNSNLNPSSQPTINASSVFRFWRNLERNLRSATRLQQFYSLRKIKI